MYSHLESNFSCAPNEVYIKEEVILPDDFINLDDNDNFCTEDIKKDPLEEASNTFEKKGNPLPIFKRCSNCNIRVRKTSDRLARCRTCNDFFTYECEICNRIYKSLYKTIQHVKFDCDKEPTYKCEKCDFKTTRSKYLQLHEARQHTKVNPEDYHECTRCGKKYKRQQDKVMHERNCGVEPHIKCDQCDYKTHNQRNLRFHMTKKHITVQNNFGCKKCGKMFRLRLHLVHHMDRIHSEERKVKLSCVHCKSYNTHLKSRLIDHFSRKHNETC